MASPKIRAEAWRRPGHASFARQIADLEVISGSGSLPVNGVGEGRITLPAGYSRLAEIITPTRPTPSAAVSSLVRYFSDSQVEPIFEWIPDEVSGQTDKQDSDIDVKGAGIDSILGYGRVEAWDWTGIDDEHSFWPDWIWGGKNILGDLTGTYNPATVRAWNDADDGTFTIGVNVDGGGVQTTSALYKGASASTVEAALIALSNVVDIDVSGSGTESSPWNIRSVDPEGEYVFTFSTGSLIGPRKVEVAGASGGTWTATIDGQTTSAIAYNASAATVKAAYEALSTVTTVAITRASTATGTIWIAYFESPDSVTTFTVADSLTPAPATVVASQPAAQFFTNEVTPGVTVPSGWRTSFNPVTNLPHGVVDEFRVTDFTGSDPAAPACDTAGIGIMFNAGAGGFAFPGIQKIVPVKPGGRYYATVTAYAQGASDTYRFVIRDLYENGIAVDPSFTTGTTLTANTWTTFFIPVIDIPTDVDRVIFRFASITGVDSPPTFLACIEMREGMPPTTWGDIWTQLWLDATTDHLPGRCVWEIGTTNTPYLTLDFDAVNDSNGNPWADPEVSITLKRLQSYLRVRGEDAKMGYEGRIVPDNWQTGTYLFQLYNPGTMGVDQTLVSNGPMILGGRDPSRRDLRRFLPSATNIAVEAGGQNIARAEDTGAIAALGRIEAGQPNQDLGSLAVAATVAAQSVETNLSQAQSLSYVLTPTFEDPEPFVAYTAGDTLYVLDPPDVPIREARRIKKLSIAFNKNTVEYPIQLESESFVGVGAIYEGVNVLLREFKAIRDTPTPTDPLNYFQDPCCPSCPAILVGTVTTMAKTATFFNWTESSDLDDIVAVDAGGNLTFRTSGLYSVHVNWRMRFPVIATGWANWKIHSFASNDDGNDGSQYVMSAALSGTNMFIQVNIFHWAHLFADGETYDAGWELAVEQSASLVTGASGVLDECGLVIIRHGDGCAREQGSV